MTMAMTMITTATIATTAIIMIVLSETLPATNTVVNFYCSVSYYDLIISNVGHSLLLETENHRLCGLSVRENVVSHSKKRKKSRFFRF